MWRHDIVHRVRGTVAQRQGELVDLAQRLIRIRSENPPGDTTEISTFVVDYLRAHDWDPHWHEPSRGAVSLVATTAGGQGGHVILCGHSDTVPAGDPSGWSFPPFCGDVVDGEVRGRGASDMKGGLAAMLFASTLVREVIPTLPGPLTVAIVGDEETGGAEGAAWLLEQGLIRGDACLIGEPSPPLNPTVGQKGSCWLEITVAGKAAHGSTAPLGGDNAIVTASRVVLALQDVWHLEVWLPPDVEPLVRSSAEWMMRAGEGRYAQLLDHISVNVGVIQGGRKINMVPDQCVLHVDCRLPFGVEPADLLRRVRALLAGRVPGGDRVEVRLLRGGTASFTAPEELIVQAVLEGIRLVKGAEAQPILQWASSDARHFRRFGIPTLQYGPAHLETIHAVDERVAIADLVDATCVYATALLRYWELTA
ncbi:MAG: ArgE/DapE family deacylase [Bacillota bacterium]|nr:ArgE/DapE family deacylase [Bacillota bacterium]